MPRHLFEVAADQEFDVCTGAAYGVYSANTFQKCLANRQKHLEVAIPF